jgi:hypothetical protein
VQEIDIEVGSMDARMAARAIASRLETQPAMRHTRSERVHVTRQAQEAFLTSSQQHLVYAAMGRVTGDAPLHLYGGMLEDKRAALLDVALRAGFPSGLA